MTDGVEIITTELHDQVSSMLSRLNHDDFMVTIASATIKRGDEGKVGALMSLVQLMSTLTMVMNADERKATSQLFHEMIEILDREPNEVN